MHSGIKTIASALAFAMGTSLVAYPAVMAQDELFGQVAVQDEVPAPEILAEMAPPQLPVFIGVGGAAGIAPCKGMDLSIEQLEKLNAIKTGTLEKTAPLKAELKTLRRQLQNSLSQETLDRSNIKSLNSKINGLKAKLSEIKIASRMDSHDVFTPEQKQLLRKRSLERQLAGHKMGKRFKRMRHHRGHGPIGPRFGPPQGERSI